METRRGECLAADDGNGSVRRAVKFLEEGGSEFNQTEELRVDPKPLEKSSFAFDDRFREERNEELSQFRGALCKRRRRRSISLCGKTAQVSKRIHSIKARAETVGERPSLSLSIFKQMCSPP